MHSVGGQFNALPGSVRVCPFAVVTRQAGAVDATWASSAFVAIDTVLHLRIFL